MPQDDNTVIAKSGKAMEKRFAKVAERTEPELRRYLEDPSHVEAVYALLAFQAFFETLPQPVPFIQIFLQELLHINATVLDGTDARALGIIDNADVELLLRAIFQEFIEAHSAEAKAFESLLRFACEAGGAQPDAISILLPLGTLLLAPDAVCDKKRSNGIPIVLPFAIRPDPLHNRRFIISPESDLDDDRKAADVIVDALNRVNGGQARIDLRGGSTPRKKTLDWQRRIRDVGDNDAEREYLNATLENEKWWEEIPPGNDVSQFLSDSTWWTDPAMRMEREDVKRARDRFRKLKSRKSKK